MCEDYLTFMTPEMKPLRKSWIRPVLRKLHAFARPNKNVARSESESEEESGPDSTEEDTDTGKDVAFTFLNIMKVLERSMEKPDVAVCGSMGLPSRLLIDIDIIADALISFRPSLCNSDKLPSFLTFTFLSM